MNTIENSIVEFQNQKKELEPQAVIKDLLLGWISNDGIKKLNGIERSNKAYLAFELIELFNHLKDAENIDKITHLETFLLENNGFAISGFLEELFTSWLGDHNGMLGGADSVHIYKETMRLKSFFSTLQTSQEQKETI